MMKQILFDIITPPSSNRHIKLSLNFNTKCSQMRELIFFIKFNQVKQEKLSTKGWNHVCNSTGHGPQNALKQMEHQLIN